MRNRRVMSKPEASQLLDENHTPSQYCMRHERQAPGQHQVRASLHREIVARLTAASGH
jgi:hypothetical protein